MKKIKITTVRECLADLLELPGDLAYHGCIITLIGEREILLENYRSILEYPFRSSFSTDRKWKNTHSGSFPQRSLLHST